MHKNRARLAPRWWGRWDSNPHGLLHMILSHARLPIPPLPRTSLIIKAKRVLEKGKWWAAVRKPYSWGAMGNTKEKVLPSPGALLTLMVVFNPWANSRASANPLPVPP